MKRISVFGSTGSIGVQTLEVIRNHRNAFRVVLLTANINNDLLFSQAIEFKPDSVCLVKGEFNSDQSLELKRQDIKIYYGRDDLINLASRSDIDIMLNALVGYFGMEPTITAIKSGVNIALSNKESMVMAGSLIDQLAKDNDVKILPVDSEHSAIWQCLTGEKINQVKRLILTGSGGPFRNRPIQTFSSIKIEEALKHPNWNMGAKITIDSATMMNKGLEVIEAKWLFNVESDQIDIVIHPQSIIHSMVEFSDGSIKAQMGKPDMRIPIQYALTYPDHLSSNYENFDFTSIDSLTFEKPDLEKFPCIKLAYQCIESGGSYPVVLNVANDHLVLAFLNRDITFNNIPEYLEEALTNHKFIDCPDLYSIEGITHWTEQFIKKKILR
ncbi:MAG: 1-deoxy-D-xylulose-5-phosphate reductoisomerase [Candidatus Marinimicrobia bacterium]|jgi:1-deoxy-D-xylulose-5-phosphate reductoisomerase|nr:1-deoxy-D-xylulose-5-phosphate reductoisomerase [Candidatus Neomarinimicrobiota bacterium]MBT3633923.1 1-deoxy-D-xylulose-5-phosphate reductoisomerase [Candidatus Neomarinimicrobiota bacterium]MBT3682828.1 1-deoxy-D-xylulose-5-phosphate reductoisomerase [Candidatus Neomarinimicrobiota bacterium]MBT3759985.1 1-deoxy-D-xylulose-5-phosphate reductoisomerase [Candidatus Neomarinimicrobiota bacterium]MBT3896079.1 1-deoxy-D-xylulose-5-phosphate reductoisomerase [Candidatus Neomarinimicrobiota bact